MRRHWSASLNVAALGWLLALLVSPAWAYYPPLAATATSTDSTVTRQIYDLKLQKTVIYTSYYLANEVVDLKQQNGVIAWVTQLPSGYYVTCCVYDPSLKPANPGVQTPFQEDTRGPFSSVTQLQVADGVVAYVADSEFRYATYDPAKKAWQMRSWSAPGMIMQNPAVATKDGVVIFIYTAIGNYWLWADIYDPKEGMWGFGGAIGYNGPNPFLNIFITNATVNYHTTFAGIDFWDTFSYTIGQGWHGGGTTPPQAYFVARPASGPAPSWVWFTDMSIGASSWNWDFGDSSGTTSRSPHHTYTANGAYTATQSVNSGASMFTKTISVGTSGIEPLLLLLLH